MEDQKMSPVLRRTKKSFSMKESSCAKERVSLNFATLNYIDPYSPLRQHHSKYSNEKRLSVNSVIDYVLQAIGKIYESDPIGVSRMVINFLKQKLPQIKPKIQERLSLLKYLEQSLMYKLMSEIDVEILQEWHKNKLLNSLMAVWARSVLLYQFCSEKEFVEEYEKQRNFVANLTYYYFRTVLQIHQKKGNTFDFIFEDTSHHIINSFVDWRRIYDQKFIPLLIPKKGLEYELPNLDYNLNTLAINPQYMELNEQTNQLQKTTEKIQAFAKQYRIHERITLLKQIRAAFLSEIEANQQRIMQHRMFNSVKSLQKDDIIGCMIYCIIKGQISQLYIGLKALSLLLGAKSELLNRKGADCCRADLESAVQHLQQEQLNSPLIKIPKDWLLSQ